MEGKDIIEAWDLLREAGPGACSTPTEIRAVLDPLRRPLNHRDVAGCLSLFMRTWIDSTGIRAGLSNLSLNGSSTSASSLSANQWKVDAFVDSVPKSVNWDFVVRSLDDFPDLRIESQDAFSSVLVNAYKRARRQSFIPGALFLSSDWKHSGVQATLLLHALNNEEVRFEPTVEGGRDTKWSCVSLVETLLRLAERGHHGVCHAAFQIGRATDPDSLLLSLLWSKPAYEQLREELYAALVPALLERALRDDVEAIRVLGIVWSLNKELVIRGMLDVLTRDAEVLNLVIRLPDALAMLSRLPLRVFLAAICAAAARDPSFQLETLLRERLAAISSQELLAASIREVLRFVESRQQGPDSRAAPRLPPNCLNAIFSALQASKPPEMATEIGQAAELYREGEPDKIEAQANATFQLIYSEQMDIEQVITMLSRFKDSDNPQEQAVFQCMIHNLFDEYRFFQNYPPRELRITGILFGNLIQHQLLSSWTLSMAINYVIKALRQAPTTEPDAKMFRFGALALEQFTSRLPDMPHVTADILAIPHFAEAEPVLYAEVERAKALASSPSVPPASPATQAAATLGAIGISLPPSSGSGVDGAWSSVGADGNVGAQGAPWPTALRGSESPEAHAALCRKLDTIIGGPTSEEAPQSPGTQFEDQIQFLINNLTMANLEEKVAQARQVILEENFAWTAYYMVVGRISTQANFHGLYLQFIDALNEKKLLFELRQRTLVQVRKLLKSNKIVTSTTERSVLKNLGSWLGQLTLAKNRPLLQREVDLKELLLDGYERGWMIAVVPFAAKVLEKAQHSRVFTSSNPWMSGILGVLAEIYHLPDVKLHLKFETEVLCRCLSIDLQSITATNLLQSRIKPRLVSNPDFNSNSAAATPTATVVTPSSSLPPSAVLATAFGPPQGQQGGHIGTGGSQSLNLPMPQLPFTQQTPGTSMGVPFQQQFGPSLYGNEESQRSKHQRAPGPQVAGSTQQQSQMGLPGMGALPVAQEVAPIPTETVIPNLGNYVFVNSQLALFARHPDLKRVVPVAVDRAIREIIQPAVERSVSIATITTKELILKDFAMEPDETRMLNAAHLMITNLAGSLALVTCKEHLRLSMASHIRSLLTSQALNQEDMQLVEQVVQTCSTENLELGCLLIEKAATDKAVRDIDEALEPACAMRREHRERGQVYYDTSIFNNGMRFPNSLPQQLRPRPLEGGLAGEQLAVYEAFLRAPRPPIAAPSTSAPPIATVVDVPQTVASGLPVASTAMTAPTTRMLTMQQALEKYKTVVSALDIAVTQLLQQPGFHDLPASSLPADHDIIHKLHFLRSIIAATAPETRFDVALIVAQSVFRRLFESSPTERLRLSVQVGVLDAVSSALGGVGLRKKITDWVIGSIAKGNLNAPVTAALVDANLVRGVELDNLIADLLEGQLSTVTCAFALELVQHCVVQSRSWPVVEASRTLNFLSNIGIGSSSLATPPGLPRLLEEVADVAVQQSSGVTQFRGQPGQAPSLVPSGVDMLNGQSTAVASSSVHNLPPFVFTRNPAIDPQAWKDVELALQRWIVVSRDGGSAAQFLAGLKDKGLLRGDQNIERFFYLCTELCVESFLTIVAQHTPSDPANQANAQADEIAKSRLAYTGVDSYGVLVSLLVKLADHRVRPTLAAQALEAVAKVMAYDVTTRFGSGHEAGFDQRPYFRMILNFQRELLSIPSSGSVLASAPTGTNEAELNESADKLLAVFAEAHHHYFSPEHAPGFCFAWLELISHHSFMPRLLKEERGWSVLHRLLIDLFTFMEPYLKSVQLTPAVRILYKGTLRVLLVLLHDFPEFLCFFHFSLCNVIPPTCVQLRNLILSAFPRTMRLPDPFTPNLKVDLLPEITVHPRILADYTAVLDQAQGNLRADVDQYLRTRNQPARFLSTLCDRLRASGNWHALNALVLHVGVSAITYSKIADTDGQDPSASSYLLGAKDIFQTLASDLDAEGRYQFLNAIANHLRYPNSHTHYFSCVILGLFKEGSELVQEQVTRVLLERLIVHRPHPWGLLVTFIELMKNPRYSFWDHSFTRCTPEIHKVFESVASSCGAGQTVAMS